MKLNKANIDDASEINDLLNLAYRGKEGWTTETDLVEGERSKISDVKFSIENSTFLIYKKENVLVGCICLEKNEQDVYIGSFAVNPSRQKNGLGNSILIEAENYAVDKLKAKKLIMVVVSKRDELIDYYERRGYIPTGITKEYPYQLNVRIPKVSDLSIVGLYKNA